MYTCRLKFKFEAAHILDEAFSKCCMDSIHGHSYIVEVFVSSNILNGEGMVLDFGLLKSKVKPLIDAWDHRLFIPKVLMVDNWMKLPPIRTFTNPTAENISLWIYEMLKEMRPKLEFKVRLYETAVLKHTYCERSDF